MGFEPAIPDDLIDPHPLNYANTEEYRANHLIQTLTDEEAKVILAIRGDEAHPCFFFISKISNCLIAKN